jgi:glyoxalase/bleomycin resistance protein/dioxygenase superfamily protein
MPDRDRKIDYVEFTSNDIEATKQFYNRVFGWQFVDYGPTTPVSPMAVSPAGSTKATSSRYPAHSSSSSSTISKLQCSVSKMQEASSQKRYSPFPAARASTSVTQPATNSLPGTKSKPIDKRPAPPGQAF